MSEISKINFGVVHIQGPTTHHQTVRGLVEKWPPSRWGQNEGSRQVVSHFTVSGGGTSDQFDYQVRTTNPNSPVEPITDAHFLAYLGPKLKAGGLDQLTVTSTAHDQRVTDGLLSGELTTHQALGKK